jgi:tetratricopeptide (TPR) repeat protein
MAIVTLRAYLDELQALIESEALEEVIGHCKYILQTYPKNVAVYRLLGSALLDKARYQEAADVFQRVLSAVPDDMIAHAAMFQIYQESDAVQPATWHLERAFEQNPNSQPLKDELRSLYGRRDGTPPERIQMTRGGLARAYFQGQLYEQATAELEKILTEEPNRADLLLLLARTYLANNHPVEAGEAALRVLSMLPDALEANALLAQLWLEHQRPSDASPFVERVEALDPFLALKLLKPDDPNAGEALVLSRLDWNARATAALLTETPDWMENMGEMFDASGRPAGSTDPFGLERRATAAQPDWMSNFATPSETPVTASDWFAEAAASAPAPAADPFALPALNSSDDVPDWFAEVSANANQPNRDSNGPTNASRRNQPAPDVENSAWLQDATDFMAAPPPSRDQHSGFTDLLGEITTARQQDEPPPSWVDDLGDALSGTQPDWLNDFSTAASPASLDSSAFGADHPSAIDDLFSNWTPEAATSDASESDWSNVAGADAEPDLTDWMTNFEPAGNDIVPPVNAPAPVSTLTDNKMDSWLSDFGASAEMSNRSAEVNDATDWMTDIAPSESPSGWAAPAETSGTAADSAEDDWLSGIGGAGLTEAAAEPEAANVPDWMNNFAPSEVPAVEVSPVTIDSGTDDDWMSSLRDVDSTEPETVNVPDWMSALAPSESPAIATEPTAVDSGDDWLSGLGGLDTTEAAAEPETANVPDWMSALAPSESPAAEPEAATIDSGDDWLSGLGGLDTTEAAAEPEVANVPDWMSALAPSESPAVDTEPATADSGDDWLSGLGGLGTTEVAAESETANVPDWMSALDSNTGTDTLDIPLQPAEDDEWERAFEPDSPTAQLPRPVDVSSVADDEQNNDWLSNVAAQTPSKSDDWLSQFAVIEHSPDLDQAIEGLPSTRDLDQADDTLPDWMRDTERASITSEAATPDWMRDTEKTTISSDIVSDFFGADDEKQESSSGYGQSRHSGMTGLLNAMALPKSEPPAFAGNTDVLDEQTLPDWMTAFTDEIMPEPAAPVEILPDRAAEMTGPDRSNPTEPANDFSDWSQPEPPAKPETMAAPNTAVDESMPIEDELFDSQAIPDWLSALAPADHLDANVTPEPETAILDLSNAEPDIDIDSLLSDAEGGFSGGDEVLDEAQIPAWMRDDEGLVTVPEAQPLAQQPVSQPAAPIPIVPEAEPVAEVEPASGETSGGFTFKRKPAWLTKIKK